MAIPLVISGCCGRMGQRIAALALTDGGFALRGALEHAHHAALGQDLSTVLGSKPLGVTITSDADAVIRQGSVVIDFTTPEATLERLERARQAGAPMVIGTTGLSAAQLEGVQQSARQIPIVFSPNMSLGVNLLFELVRLAVGRLGLAYDVAVVEAHHRQKKDTPSGTAKRLAQLIAEARGQHEDAVPVHAIRAGDIIGDHVVTLAGPAERLELVHRAHSRDAFAAGALQAARFVHDQKPGLYDMSHVLEGLAAPVARVVRARGG